MTNTDRTSAFYDAIDAFQRTHRLPSLQHAQIRGLLAEHLARAVPDAPAVVEPPADQTGEVRDQLLHAIDFNYVASLGYTSPEELLAAYDTSRTQPADRAALHRIAEAALAAVETALGDTLAADAREEALAGIAAVLPEPADRAAVLREAADVAESLRQFERSTGARWAAQVSENVGILRVADELRRMADEAATETPASEPTAEDIARTHVTSLHLIGEQLATIEYWFWEHLADVRAAGARQDGAQP